MCKLADPSSSKLPFEPVSDSGDGDGSGDGDDGGGTATVTVTVDDGSGDDGSGSGRTNGYGVYGLSPTIERMPLAQQLSLPFLRNVKIYLYVAPASPHILTVRKAHCFRARCHYPIARFSYHAYSSVSGAPSITEQRK
uniref:Uncharacterized protein n=1 Tax=Vespula pensylvanica TaxID=30213 RepID=A0A834NY65_VESPE|nr:hypothetical protein H0235_010929 [Vespula pensylvanica]